MTPVLIEAADTHSSRDQFRTMLGDYAGYMRSIGNTFFRAEEDGRISPSPDRAKGDVVSDAFDLPGSTVHFIMVDEAVAGFAWMTTRTFPHHRQDRDVNIAEFWIDPAHRQKGLGRFALNALLDQYKGEWVIAMIKTNTLALSFWPKEITQAANERTTMSAPTIEEGEDDIRYRFIVS